MNSTFNWHTLTSTSQLDSLLQLSYEKQQLIFKHSTRCSISALSLNRLERNTPDGTIDFWLLDLIKHRDVSNTIAEKLQVQHESPQVLLIKNGECIYCETHNAISFDEIIEQSKVF